MAKKSPSQIYKDAKSKRGYKGSFEDFKTDFGNSEEYFFDSIGEWRQWKSGKKLGGLIQKGNPKLSKKFESRAGYNEGGLISGKPKLAKKGWK